MRHGNYTQAMRFFENFLYDVIYNQQKNLIIWCVLALEKIIKFLEEGRRFYDSESPVFVNEVDN